MEYQFEENSLRFLSEERPIHSFMSLMKQHKARYHLNLSNGSTIIMRHMPKKEHDRILAYTMLLYPNYAELYEKYLGLMEKASAKVYGPEELETFLELMTEANAALAQIRPASDLRAIGVIEQPYLWDKDSVAAFYDSLPEEDEVRVRQAVDDLSMTIPMESINFDEYWIAQRFGLSIMDEETLANMTLLQAQMIAEVTRQERIEQERELRRLQG